MICLMDTSEPTVQHMRPKLLHKRNGCDGVIYRQIAVLGIRVAYITIEAPKGIRPRQVVNRIHTAIDCLRTQRISTISFSWDFPYREHFLREGFTEPDESPLLEMLSASIVENAVVSRKSVVLFVQMLNTTVIKTLEALSRSFKTVMLVTDSGHELCRALGRQYGISVVLNPPPDRLKDADAAVFFCAPDKKIVLSEKTVAIPASPKALCGVSYHTAVSGLKIELAGEAGGVIPKGFDAVPITAAALSSGTLDTKLIRLRAIRFKQSLTT